MNISIIITTYNAAAYITETLHSIAQQSYSNFEVVIVDDGSVDATLNRIDEFMSHHPHIQYRTFPLQHIGRAAALKYGVQQASHEWVAILDADDLWHKDKLKIQVQFITQKQLNFLATDTHLFFDRAHVEIDKPLTIDHIQVEKITLSGMLYTNQLSHSSVLFKKELAQYNLKRKSQIDYDLWLRLLQQGENIYLLKEKLAYHRIHAGQSFEAKKRFRYILNATLLQLKYCCLNLKILPALYVLTKLGYYFLLSKKMRFKLREYCHKAGVQKKCVE